MEAEAFEEAEVEAAEEVFEELPEELPEEFPEPEAEEMEEVELKTAPPWLKRAFWKNSALSK